MAGALEAREALRSEIRTLSGDPELRVRALVGLLPAARGHIHFDGSALLQWSEADAGRFIGHLSQLSARDRGALAVLRRNQALIARRTGRRIVITHVAARNLARAAALAARRDPDFLIIARSDADSVSIAELTERYRRLGIEESNPLNAITAETRAALEAELGGPPECQAQRPGGVPLATVRGAYGVADVAALLDAAGKLLAYDLITNNVTVVSTNTDYTVSSNLTSAAVVQLNHAGLGGVSVSVDPISTDPSRLVQRDQFLDNRTPGI